MWEKVPFEQTNKRNKTKKPVSCRVTIRRVKSNVDWMSYYGETFRTDLSCEGNVNFNKREGGIVQTKGPV